MAGGDRYGGAMEALHVTNGDSAGQTIERTSLGGEVISWNDVLHEGPLAFDPDASRDLRSRFLAECGWGDETAILGELERRDRALAEARHVVLWFEHDLFDQLQLLQILSQVRNGQRLELIQADDYLGPLDVAALEALWETRREASTEMFALAREAWRAVCDDEIEPVLRRDTAALPYLEPALRRLLEERSPLSRTKRQLLTALAQGPSRPPELFVANQQAEEAVFLGDTWCFRQLHELAQDGLVTELPAPPPRGDHAAFAATPVELTAAGRAVL
jgi:hypothetical protein